MAMALKGLVGVVALLLGLLGLRWMFAPEGAAAELSMVLEGVAALNTARGDLGGMFVVGAVMCGLGLWSGEGRWLQAVAIVIGCVAGGRVVGLVLDGFATSTLMPIGIEVTMVAILLAGARQKAGAV